ncbi:MAG: N,N-dimethylformamidase beta subunit family domain-containing protein [Dermatophilaceae bacterium]
MSPPAVGRRVRRGRRAMVGFAGGVARNRVLARGAAVCALGALAGCGYLPGPGPGESGQAGETTQASAGHDPRWVVTENARDGASDWRIGDAQVAGDTQLAGYFGQVSVTPGEPATLYLTSTVGDVQITAYRLGWYAGRGAREVWASARPVAGSAQAPPEIASDRTVTTRWKPSATIDTTGWPEGSYLFVLRADSTPGSGRQTGRGSGLGLGTAKYVPLVVRSASVRDRLVLSSPVTTYQAYNRWGGHSLYKGPDLSFRTRSSRVSFDRPYDRNGAMETFKFEVPIVSWAERLGLDLAYTSAVDLEAHGDALDGARGLVTMGHDEYWTVPERHAVEAARGRGINLAFLGANAAYWRIRLEPGVLGERRMIVGYKSAAADPVTGPQTTAMWRQMPHPRPENSLTGMLYECFPARGPFVVHDPTFFLFEGTGASAGRPYAGLVGSEIDRAYPLEGTPPSLQVVAHSPVTCANRGVTAADAVYYTDPSGAGVFSTGTMMWATALAGTTGGASGLDGRSVSFARAVTDNLLTAMAAGPMGRKHPAHPNLAAVGAPASTEHGTGGPVAGSDAGDAAH